MPGTVRTTAFVGLGSNLGSREKNIAAALNALETTRGISVTRVSSLYETDPVGGPADQPAFVNAVAQIETALSAPRLLAVCQKIEETLGRKRTDASGQTIRWGPRTIDLDLLIFGDEVHSTTTLTIPHPLMHERRFVMEPFVEIAPDFVHPMLNRTARQILDSLGQPADDGD